MIAYIEGRLAEMTENACVVVTAGGVGYEVYLPGHTLASLPAKGEFVSFHTCTVVREDALELFGFAAWDERETFLLLTTINRVGARTALAVLTVFRPDDLRRLVSEDDMLSLTRVSGIGKKSAQQIFLELKYKLKGEAGRPAVVPAAGSPGSVLINLGYAEEEALHTVKKVLAGEPDLDVGGALRAALKALAGGRK